ncbi:hypothetical protein [Marinicrinis sediminis]|uniref:DUF1404 domain-containing protein n=1 Tax=Marinicrinis sediminis TaxID=1652465 RepID=A0ABW5R9A5_9BACL
MLPKLIAWLFLIVPWITLLGLRKKSLKRFMPVGILASFIMAVYNVIASHQKHWIIKVNIIPLLKPLFVPGVFGMFLVVTIWVFHLTYSRFWLYLAANIGIDFMFAVFPVHYLLQDVVGIYELVNITTWQRMLLFVGFSIILYGFQRWLDEVLIENAEHHA